MFQKMQTGRPHRASHLKYSRLARCFVYLSGFLSLMAGSGAFAADPAAGFTKPEAKRYVEQAFQIAGKDFQREATSLCRAVTPPPPVGMPDTSNVRVFEPARIFDNIYYFGSTYVGATVVQTSDGLILIDTLTNDEAAADILVSGMKKIGLDPARIRYVILTHAHGDHYGGVKYLRAHYSNFRVVASEDDWAVMAKPGLMPDGSPDPSPKEPRAPKDIGYRNAYELTLGDTTLHLIETPGHTPGTTSLIYPARQMGRTYKVMQWGGGATSDPRFSLATVENYVAAARDAGVVIRWGSHPRLDWVNEQFDWVNGKFQARPAANVPGLLIDGEERMNRYLDVILACKRAFANEHGLTRDATLER